MPVPDLSSLKEPRSPLMVTHVAQLVVLQVHWAPLGRRPCLTALTCETSVLQVIVPWAWPPVVRAHLWLILVRLHLQGVIPASVWLGGPCFLRDTWLAAPLVRATLMVPCALVVLCSFLVSQLLLLLLLLLLSSSVTQRRCQLLPAHTLPLLLLLLCRLRPGTTLDAVFCDRE